MRGIGMHVKQDHFVSDKLLFFIFLLAGILALFHPTVLSGLSLMQTDPGDTRFNNYILEHGFQWMSGNPSNGNFWDLPMFFPARNTAAYSDILLGAAPPYWLFRLVGFLPDTAFQLWMLAMGILNYSVAYWTMRRGVGLSALASTGGAYLFAFAALRANQMSHQQLLPQFFSMLAVYCLIMIVRNEQSPEMTSRWKPRGLIVLLFASLVLQLFAGFYLGYFLCLGLATLLGAAFFFREGRSAIGGVVRRHAAAIVLAVAIATVPLAWMGYHYVQGEKEVGSRKWSEVSIMVPRPISWINMGPESWLYGWTRPYLGVSGMPLEWEHRLGLGLVTLAITGIGLFRMSRETWGLIALLASLVIALIAFTYLWSIVPWWVIFKIAPGAGAIRAVTRISLLLLIAFSFGLAFFLDSIKNRTMALALLVLVCLEQGVTTPSYAKHAIRCDVNRLASQIPADSKGFYYAPCFISGGNVQAWDELVYKHQIDAMYASLIAGVPTVNGYSGSTPQGWSELENVLIRSKSDADRIRKALGQWLRLHGLDSSSIAVVGNQKCCKDRFHTSNCTGIGRFRPQAVP